MLGFDDTAGAKLSDAATLATGTNWVTNYEGDDPFPAPAPGNSPVVATNLAALIGSSVNGNWRLYVLDDAAGDEGSIAMGWHLTLNTAPAPAAVALISEFRLRGPTSAVDEYVEIHNASDRPLVVESVDGSAGWAVASTNGILFVISNGTVLPARGHFLGVNAVGYSLLGVPAVGPGTTASGDLLYFADIADNAGIAFFRCKRHQPQSRDPVGCRRFHGRDQCPLQGRRRLSGDFAVRHCVLLHSIRLHSEPQQRADEGFKRQCRRPALSGHGGGPLEQASAWARRVAENLSSPQRLATGDILLEMDLLDPAAGVTGSPNRVRSFVPDPPNNSSRQRLPSTGNSPTSRRPASPACASASWT